MSTPVDAEVSHEKCVGVGMCVQLAPRAFKLNDVGQAEVQPGDWPESDLQEAADGCPMSAIRLVPRDG